MMHPTSKCVYHVAVWLKCYVQLLMNVKGALVHIHNCFRIMNWLFFHLIMLNNGYGKVFS